ncbi:metallophosphoesterase [Acidobacteria bacterium AB60]|nr:metallophosphoesterase [Acidobacteria bacterium AB60]
MHSLRWAALAWVLSPVFSQPGFCQAAAGAPTPVFRFAVSGDSRNCGDVVMPAIAAAVHQEDPAFYWHLGDYRAIYDFDEDMVAPAALQVKQPHMTISDYLAGAWPDFIKNQLSPFGDLEVFLGVGNHEMIPPKDRNAFLLQFGPYFDQPAIRVQRAQDHDLGEGLRTYYHWVKDGVDFLTLDNATDSTFDSRQMDWIRARLDADGKDAGIKTVVVGMHEALPGSVGLSHSMCDSGEGIATGREVYELLWSLQAAGKHVYVLASHSHFVAEDVYRTPYWGDHVLPGWIVGTAGAVRYRLPAEMGTRFARTDVYGYLLGTVMSDGSIHFDFKEVSAEDLQRVNGGKYPDAVVGWCSSANKDERVPKPVACVGVH